MEFQRLIEYANMKSQNTQRIYKHHYKLLHQHFNCDIADVSFDKLKSFIDNLDIAPNTKAMYLNVIIVINKFCGGTNADIEDLLDYRADLTQAIQINLKRVNNSLDLPSMNTILHFMQESLEKKNYRRYIINFLLIHYFVRNQDLSLDIVDDLKKVEEGKNYLVLKKNPKHIIYIRQRYKTFKQHGRKEYIIDSPDFYKAVKELFDTDEPLINISLQHAVINNTYQKLGESNYLKISINHIRETGNLNLLKHISERRGTSYPVLLNSYNALV